MVDHEVQLYGAALNGAANAAPVLIGRPDPDFLNTMLREVRTPSGRNDLKSTVVSGGSAALPSLLYQPVQRMFHMALMEAFCNTPGNPRLDPRKIDSAGVVIRRVPAKPSSNDPRKLVPDFQTTVREGWMQNAQGAIGWVALNTLQQKLDPDPKRRRLLHTGQSYLDQVLNNKVQGSVMSEAVSPAFPAPPDACADAGKTIIFALLPLTSSQLSKSSTAEIPDSATLQQHLPVLLQQGNKMAPLAGKSITPKYASEDYLRTTTLSPTDQSQFKNFMILLNTMAIEFGIFEADADDKAQALFNTVNSVSVTFQDPNTNAIRHQAVGDFLRTAKTVLLDNDPASTTLWMPTSWPQVSENQAQDIVSAMTDAIQKKLNSIPRNRGRFQNPDRIYQLQAFLRVKHDDNCPPCIVWSAPSGYFQIAAWYDGPGIPTPPVVLPDLSDRNALKKLKPNVSFGVPASLFNSMQGASLDGLMKGNKGGNGGLNLDWICSFNIPIITICAFFVLNIFLSLLNIIFWWLPLIKICIPIPKGTLNSD
jgi:hypothetical protein